MVMLAGTRIDTFFLKALTDFPWHSPIEARVLTLDSIT